MEFQNKNDYTLIVFFENNIEPIKMPYVHNCYTATQWLSNSNNYKNWNYINVYARRTNRYIKRYYKDNFIEPKPKL